MSNPVFLTRTFWQPYLTLESGDLIEADFTAQLDGLRRDFVVLDEEFHYGSGEQRTAIRHFVEFPFYCGEQYSMIVEYEPGVGGCYTNLFLIDNNAGTKTQMGWWDLARWHPYCIRPEEFDTLLQFWNRWDGRWEGQELPLLLLCQFVGLPDSDTCDSLTARAVAALHTLGLPSSGNDQPKVSLFVPDGDYRWDRDEELGWVFTSDDYCCYSLRNRPHAESDEGAFPFAAFREMIAGVERRLAGT